MSNTVITNYTDLNGPTSKADSSVVVIVNKDGSLSVDENLLGTLMGSDGSQGAGISVVRVGHEGRPDDATDSETDDDKVPHVTLSVDSYYNEPNSIIKYDSGAEMLQSLRIETRETSLLGFQNDHCYTPLTAADQTQAMKTDSYAGFDDPIIEIKQQPPPRPSPLSSSKKITILDQKVIPKGRKIVVNASNLPFKSRNISSKAPAVQSKSKLDTSLEDKDVDTESSGESTEESGHDRDSDSDYKDAIGKPVSHKKTKGKPRILKNVQPFKRNKPEPKQSTKGKPTKSLYKPDVKVKHNLTKRQSGSSLSKHKEQNITIVESSTVDLKKEAIKSVKKDKKPPAHMNALLSDMTSLFSTPDVIRRISTDKSGKDGTPSNKSNKTVDQNHSKDKNKNIREHQRILKQRGLPTDKAAKGYELIPQIDEASLAQILEDTAPVKGHPTVTTSNTINSPGLAGPLSPTLDLLTGLQAEEEGLTEDLLMHVAQLVESSENLQEVIDKQVLGKVDSKTVVASPSQTAHTGALYTQALKSAKVVQPKKDPIEIVRKDGRIITLPPIEAPATRSSKRKTQVDPSTGSDVAPTSPVLAQVPPSFLNVEQQQLPVQYPAKHYINKKPSPKKDELLTFDKTILPAEKVSAESQESWNSEDDPNRLWCICRQPHNNRFMICCDGCEDWFHGKCVNITKAMGQQMEEQGIEWRCPNCIKKTKGQKTSLKTTTSHLKHEDSSKPPSQSNVVHLQSNENKTPSKSSCIVCRKPARGTSVYCSDACILKYAQDSLQTQGSVKTESETGKNSEKNKNESRVIVFERKTGRCLAGPNAPTAENLKAWLQKNPTFEVVRPGTLNALKPNVLKRKSSDSGKIQTTLNFEKISKKPPEITLKSPPPIKEISKVTTPKASTPKLTPPKQETPKQLQQKSPLAVTKPQRQNSFESNKPTTSSTKMSPSDVKKPVRAANRSQSAVEKASPSPSTSRQKQRDTPDSKSKMNSVEPIRENVRKALQEQMSIRMAETSGPKFTEDEIHQFAIDTEAELNELFKDVGVKYKAKYRSLMFNIKDRKNQSLWQKICDKTITPNQLVRFSPEELASQELAQWRDKEAKHQLELIKKNELDLLAASKTYVLKTHKGEEVMETKTATTTTDVDPNVPVEDLVTVLNDSTTVEDKEIEEPGKSSDEENRRSRRKRSREDSQDSTKKSKRESDRKSDRRTRSDSKSHDRPSRRSGRTNTRRSSSKDRSKKDDSKKESKREEREKQSSDSRSRSSKAKKRSRSKSRERSRSKGKSRRRSRSREDSSRKLRSRSKHRLRSDDKKRSKSQDIAMKKNVSPGSDTIERPKSAMMKEVHPEYDPHEPMITSAFSEEDLRKSREDVYEAFKSDEMEYEAYDPEKAFTIAPNIMSSPRITRSKDKASEVESDQEPSSTVENAAATVWSGCINMVDVARFYVSAHEVSGITSDLEEELSAELEIVGRIDPNVVWDYIVKMKRTGNKDIVVLRLQAANDEEKMQYIALYSYLNSRSRLGVVKVLNAKTVKDFYIVPLAANAAVPPVLLPLEGPGLEDTRSHLLLAVVVRQWNKRPSTRVPAEILPPKVTRSSRKRSYTPPPAILANVLSRPYSSPALSSTVKDKIAASLAAADENEAYSPGSSSSESGAAKAGPPGTLRTKMEELNRQIEEQKQQIRKMAQADSSVGEEDEAYSPSRPMTPPPVPLADISLPSNLHEILATIKQRSSDVDMRTPRS